MRLGGTHHEELLADVQLPPASFCVATRGELQAKRKDRLGPSNSVAFGIPWRQGIPPAEQAYSVGRNAKDDLFCPLQQASAHITEPELVRRESPSREGCLVGGG